MKRLKELYNRYSEWESESVYFYIGGMSIETNRITVFIGMLVFFVIVRMIL